MSFNLVVDIRRQQFLGLPGRVQMVRLGRKIIPAQPNRGTLLKLDNYIVEGGIGGNLDVFRFFRDNTLFKIANLPRCRSRRSHFGTG